MIYQLECVVVIHIIYYMQTETFLIIFVYIFTNFIALIAFLSLFK